MTENQTENLTLTQETEAQKEISPIYDSTEPVKYEEAIEAILFAAGHPVTYDKLAETFDMTLSEIKKIVWEYARRYNSSRMPRGVIMVTYEESCQLCTKEQYISFIRYALGIRKSGTLSTSAIETLAIIAYHQPVTRAYVDAVRGVDSSYAVTNLLDRGLIDVRGRLDAPGRPMLFGTTDNFLRCFGLSSLAELPGIESEEIGKVFTAIEEKMATEDPDQISIDDITRTDDPEDTSVKADAVVPTEETESEEPLGEQTEVMYEEEDDTAYFDTDN